MKKVFVFVLLMLLVAGPSFAAGSCVQTTKTSYTAQDRVPDAYGVIVTLTCTADSGGAFPSTTVLMVPSSAVTSPWNLYDYYLYQVGRTPGTTQPTGSYTVTITDSRGFALDLGLLTSNGSASAAQLTGIYNTTTVYPVVRSNLTVAITGNSVNAAQITLDLLFKAQ